VLLGGPGQDVLDGGPGNNVVIQSIVGTIPNGDSQSAALLGQFMASSLVTAGDAHGSMPIADQPAAQQPLLAQPHA